MSVSDSSPVGGDVPAPPEKVTLDLCADCLDGSGGECHTPGCALWMNRAPDVPIRDKIVSVPSSSSVEQAVEAPIRWVRQEDVHGCGVAVLAMLTGRTYADVQAEIDAQDGHGHNGDWSEQGVSHITLDRYLIVRGYWLQRIYQGWVYEDVLHEGPALSGWPPDPWAPVHFAQVKQPSGNAHFVVMDAEGRVLDPMREGTFRLSDWSEVLNVVGVVRPFLSSSPENDEGRDDRG